MERNWGNNTSNMVIFQILLLSDKRVKSKERNTVRVTNPRASLTWTDNTSKVGYVCLLVHWKLDVGIDLNSFPPCLHKHSKFTSKDQNG